MNTLYFAIFGLSWLIFAYYWYGNKIKNKVLKTDNTLKTPAVEFNDGKDYVPTQSTVLFGHHFSSIAGAGPIVGPILAYAFFGWLPAMLWILVGSVFIGAVHDYTTLIFSVRNKGASILEISGKAISPRSRLIFTFFVWVTLVVIQAVFADLTAKTFVEKPDIVLPTFGIIGLALLFGAAVLRTNFRITPGTIITLLLLLILVSVGDNYPVHASYDLWLAVVFIYCIVASVLPVWLLLQPRDYLSVYILFIGLIMGFLGIIIERPEFQSPAVTGFTSEKGPLFPILFITVACGAISGFHAVVSSGTSSKQLKTESDGKKVAYGGMLFEAALALLVIIMIGGMLGWEGSVVPASGFVFQDLLGQSANIVFGTAFGLTSESIWQFFWDYIPFADSFGMSARLAGISFGVLILNAFILTTLDTTSRLNRYIVEETLGKKLKFFSKKLPATLISIVVAYLLCLFDGYQILWPLFGASNQLIATLTLFVITFYIIGYKSPKWYTLIPAVFMLVVSESALAYNITFKYIPEGSWHLAIISLLLFILGLVVAIESLKHSKNLTKKRSMQKLKK